MYTLKIAFAGVCASNTSYLGWISWSCEVCYLSRTDHVCEGVTVGDNSPVGGGSRTRTLGSHSPGDKGGLDNDRGTLLWAVTKAVWLQFVTGP